MATSRPQTLGKLLRCLTGHRQLDRYRRRLFHAARCPAFKRATFKSDLFTRREAPWSCRGGVGQKRENGHFLDDVAYVFGDFKVVAFQTHFLLCVNKGNFITTYTK